MEESDFTLDVSYKEMLDLLEDYFYESYKHNYYLISSSEYNSIRTSISNCPDFYAGRIRHIMYNAKQLGMNLSDNSLNTISKFKAYRAKLKYFRLANKLKDS